MSICQSGTWVFSAYHLLVARDPGFRFIVALYSAVASVQKKIPVHIKKDVKHRVGRVDTVSQAAGVPEPVISALGKPGQGDLNLIISIMFPFLIDSFFFFN